jgi:hypothetical protein
VLLPFCGLTRLDALPFAIRVSGYALFIMGVLPDHSSARTEPVPIRSVHFSWARLWLMLQAGYSGTDNAGPPRFCWASAFLALFLSSNQVSARLLA